MFQCFQHRKQCKQAIQQRGKDHRPGPLHLLPRQAHQPVMTLPAPLPKMRHRIGLAIDQVDQAPGKVLLLYPVDALTEFIEIGLIIGLYCWLARLPASFCADQILRRQRQRQTILRIDQQTALQLVTVLRNAFAVVVPNSICLIHPNHFYHIRHLCRYLWSHG